jgi:cell division GTPase FtsZ
MGLGGGTGSGGGPETVRIAKELVKERGGDTEKDVIVIATLPEPSLDGDRQCFNALKAYGELSRLEVPVLTVDNTQIRKIIRTTLDDYWTQMNRWVVRTFHQFNVYAARPSNMGVGLDGKDLEDTLSRGRFIFSAFLVRTLGQQAAENIMTDHLEKSLFARTKLSTAEAAACILILNRPAVRGKSTEDISGIFEALNSLMKNASTLHKGSYLEDVPLTAKGASPPDLFCYVMLGGLDHPWETLNALFDRARRCSEEYGSVSAFLTA